MFRKAKKLSQRLGLKKENCTNQSVHPVSEEDKSEVVPVKIIEPKLEQLPEKQETIPRPMTIKFELPATPPRSRSPPSRLAYPRARPYRSLPEDGLVLNKKRDKKSGWRQLFSDDSDSEPEAYVTMGAYVRLKKRPLPTFGYVEFIGGVDFGKGEWVGVELDHRVGNCDGSVDGVRYFKTENHRGIFCKRNDLEAQ